MINALTLRPTFRSVRFRSVSKPTINRIVFPPAFRTGLAAAVDYRVHCVFFFRTRARSSAPGSHRRHAVTRVGGGGGESRDINRKNIRDSRQRRQRPRVIGRKPKPAWRSKNNIKKRKKTEIEFPRSFKKKKKHLYLIQRVAKTYCTAPKCWEQTTTNDLCSVKERNSKFNTDRNLVGYRVNRNFETFAF